MKYYRDGKTLGKPLLSSGKMTQPSARQMHISIENSTLTTMDFLLDPGRGGAGISHSSTHLRIMFFFFWPRRVACRILVPGPGIEPMPPALGVQSLNHWTTGEVQDHVF